MNFLFWNIGKNNLVKELQILSEEFDIDHLILCEFKEDIPEFLKALNTDRSIYKYLPAISNNKIHLFTRWRLPFFKLVSESKRFSIWQVDHPFYDNFLLGAAHLPSKLHWQAESQLIETTIFRDAIETARIEKGIDKIITVGDFNMNPFEPGLTATTAFHATQDLNLAKASARTVQGKSYRYFYNPMWNFFGDQSIGAVPGTYYYKSSQHVNTDWSIFDQVILSPEIADSVPMDSLDIIAKTTHLNLLKPNGLINEKISDHLPIRFYLKPNIF